MGTRIRDPNGQRHRLDTLPAKPSERDRAAFHEAGHAIAGTLIYGDGFVIKVRMTGSDPRTGTRIREMGNNPLRCWRGGGLVDLSRPDWLDLAEALGTFCLAGMAADWVAHESYQPSPPDIRAVNEALDSIDHPWSLIEPSVGRFTEDLLSKSPYSSWFQTARDLLIAHRTPLGSVAGWLLETDTLQGSEIEALIRGEEIRKCD